ncbi:MAG: UDP-glucose dehydrogenase family protein [Thermoplasmata archaeon]
MSKVATSPTAGAPQRRTGRRNHLPIVGVAGLGYMGLATALGFAHHGRTVRGFDVRPELRRSLSAGLTEINEPGLSKLLSREVRNGHFRMVDSWSELAHQADILFLCLPTPQGPHGKIDLAPLTKGVEALGRALTEFPDRRLVVVKSSVVAGTTEHVLAPLLQRISGRSGATLAVASNPEFLAEGSMIKDVLHPERIVLGVSERRENIELRELYAPFHAPIITLTPTGAELVKYASNAFLATKIALTNEFARIAEQIGVNIDHVLDAVGQDSRIGPSFLQAGPGFGGSCFEKDLRAVTGQARGMGLRLPTLEAVVHSNEEQSKHAYSIVRASMGGARGRRIAMLGLSFKVGTDDVRGTRAIPIVRAAVADGASVRVHDPVALANFRREWTAHSGFTAGSIRFCRTAEEALRGADVAVLHTPWPEYSSFPAKWTGLMRAPLVVDLRRGLSNEIRRRKDFVWVGLGTSRPPPVSVDDAGSVVWGRGGSE